MRLAAHLSLVLLLTPFFSACSKPEVSQEVRRKATAEERKEIERFLLDVEKDYRAHIKGMTCITGEDRKFSRKVLEYFLSSDPVTIDVWLDLAVRASMRGEELTAVHTWSARALAVGIYNATVDNNADPRFISEMKEREEVFLKYSRWMLEKHKSLYSPISRFLVWVRTWDVLPLLMDAAAINVEKGYAGDEADLLPKITLRLPPSLWRVDYYKLRGDALKAWLKDWQDWRVESCEKTPAQVLLDAALAGEVAWFKQFPEFAAQTLLDDKGYEGLDDKKMAALLKGDWPLGTRRDNRGADQERFMSAGWIYVRDWVFLVLYKRDPQKALKLMAEGLERNHSVVATTYHVELFKPLLSDKLRDDLAKLVSDEKCDTSMRMKWLILRDRFFPPDKTVWRYWSWESYENPALRDDGFVAFIHRKKGTGVHGTGYTEQGIQSLLKERGY